MHNHFFSLYHSLVLDKICLITRETINECLTFDKNEYLCKVKNGIKDSDSRMYSIRLQGDA